MKTLPVVLLVGLSLKPGMELGAQTFTIEDSQFEISIARSFDHTPVRIPVVSSSPEFDIAQLTVTSDAAWASPTTDSDTDEIILSFSTAGLTDSIYTATITATLGEESDFFSVRAAIAPLNIFKLKDDPVRSRVYGIQLNGVNAGSIVMLDPLSGLSLGNVTVGRQPTDLAVSNDGQELFVINAIDETLSVVTLPELFVKETLVLPEFENWGQGETTANVGVGSGSILYYTDGAWSPVLRVFDRDSGQVLQTVVGDSGGGNGFGDIGITGDKTRLFTWAQYGWSAGWGGSYISRFNVQGDGTLTWAESTNTEWPTVIGRDPLETPVLITADNTLVFVKQLGVSASSVSQTPYAFPGPVYSITPGGEIAATDGAIYETATGIKLYELPRTAPVQTITSDYARLVYFDSQEQSLQTINLFDVIGPEVLNRNLVPADGSITLAPVELFWEPLPGVDRYRVYLGASEELVVAAGNNSPEYLGESATPSIELVPGIFAPGTTYYWRVDAIYGAEVVTGEVFSFTVSLISASENSLDLATVRGHRDLRATVELASDGPGLSWQASSSAEWISFAADAGTTPATLEIILDASVLTAGVHTVPVTISDGEFALFSIPVQLRVDPLSLTLLKSDSSSEFVYGISEAAAIPARAYLLEINTLTEEIERVTRVGSSVTDLAVHRHDNRIYVPNWLSGSLLAIDRTTFSQVRAYSFAPFGGTGHGEGDVYRVSAGGPGRLVVEGEDQWIDVSIFDTVSGTVLNSTGTREGGGACSPDGLLYYHGDNNSSGAALHKFGLSDDQFTLLASARESPANYYGSRVVVVSQDGTRIFWNGVAYDPDLEPEWAIGQEIHAASADGQYAIANDKVYDVDRRMVVLGMPVTTTVSAYNSTTSKLIVQEGDTLGFYLITDPLTLPAPELFVINKTGNSATLGWTDRSLEESFTIQRRVSGSATWSDIVDPGQNTTEFLVTGLAEGTTYEFRIKAQTPTVSSLWSETVTVVTPLTPPSGPTISTVSISKDRVTVQWSNPVNETAFILERRIGPSPDWVQVAMLAEDVTSYTDTSVMPGALHYYRVKARNAAGDSTYSNTSSALVPQLRPPAAPSALMAHAVSGTVIQLYWEDVASENGYRVERSPASPISWSEIAVLGQNVVSYLDSSVVAGEVFLYRVRAFNEDGNSPYSNQASVTAHEHQRIFFDDFDPYVDAVWSGIYGATALNAGQGFTGSKVLWFGGATLRRAESRPLNVSAGGYLKFKLRAGNQATDGATYWEDAEPGEDVLLEYLTGTTWQELETYDLTAADAKSWKDYVVAIPSAALTTATQFRWRQLPFSGPDEDVWALDDVAVFVRVVPAPPVPDLLTSSGMFPTGNAITWSPSSLATGYVIERQNEEGSWEILATLPGNAGIYHDPDLPGDTLYSYRLKAVNTGGESAYAYTSATTWSHLVSWQYENYGPFDEAPDMFARHPDGLTLTHRFAFNLTATETASWHVPGISEKGMPAMWFDESTGRLAVEFVRRRSEMNPGISCIVQFSNDLLTWEDVPIPVTSQPLNSLWERVRFEDSATPTDQSSRFTRVKLTMP